MVWFHFIMFVVWLLGAFAAVAGGVRSNNEMALVFTCSVALLVSLSNASLHLNCLEQIFEERRLDKLHDEK